MQISVRVCISRLPIPRPAEFGTDDEAEVGVAGCPQVGSTLARRCDPAVGFDEVELVQFNALGQERFEERFGRTGLGSVERHGRRMVGCGGGTNIDRFVTHWSCDVVVHHRYRLGRATGCQAEGQERGIDRGCHRGGDVHVVDDVGEQCRGVLLEVVADVEAVELVVIVDGEPADELCPDCQRVGFGHVGEGRPHVVLGRDERSLALCAQASVGVGRFGVDHDRGRIELQFGVLVS